MLLLFSAVISLLIGVIFSVIDNTAKNEHTSFSKIFRIAEKSLVYGILGLALTTTISVIATMSKVDDTLTLLDKSLKESNKYYKARESIIQIESQTIQKLFNDGLVRITKQLDDISLRKLYVPREGIWNVWESLISTATKEVLATNLVSQKDWKHVSQDGTGLERQKEAINKGISIKRVFIYDEEREDHITGLYNLAKIQINAGVQVKFILRKDIETNSSVQDDLRDLQRILDVVITDKQSILLTEIEPVTYTMRWSYLIYEKEKIESGVHFWGRAWNNALSLTDFEQKYSEILK
jgi:hypothetical protein